MLRLSLLQRTIASATGAGFTKKPVPPTAAGAHLLNKPPTEEGFEAATAPSKAVFGMRRSPKSLYATGMKSASLSEHPMTFRAAEVDNSARRSEFASLQKENEWRMREAQTDPETAAAMARRAVQVEQKSEEEILKEAEREEALAKTSIEVFEYRVCMGSLGLGFFAAHMLVYRYFYPEDVRLPYRLDQGFTQDLLRRKEVLADVDEFIGLRVMSNVVDEKKRQLKPTA
jgi:hypothetical protein